MDLFRNSLLLSRRIRIPHKPWLSSSAGIRSFPFRRPQMPSYFIPNPDFKDASFIPSYQLHSADSDPLIFDIDDGNGTTLTHDWDPFDLDADIKPFPFLNFPSEYELGSSQISPASSYYGSAAPISWDEKQSPPPDDSLHWLNDPDITVSPYSPIFPSSATDESQMASHFAHFKDRSQHQQEQSFSPTEFAAHHPLPRSMSPSSPFDDIQPRQRVNSMSPPDPTLHTPSWASQLWDQQQPSLLRSPPPTRPSVRHSPMSDSAQRQRIPLRRGSLSSSNVFQSSSAPLYAEPRVLSMTRSYSRRAESVSVSDDRDATVRRKKRIPVTDDVPQLDKGSDAAALKPVLRPPKLAPSAWQLYFTDWIQKQQRSGNRKLNVAQAAKEAGQEYASLTVAEKEPYKRASLAAKELRERELNAYMRSLTPDDIKRENLYRAAQRKAGKSRKSNIKDPNAPKKPLSAYFMFLQRIRANPKLVQEIFGDETETTKQSVLAAAKWRAMSDGARQPFLAQAEQEKMEYEAARRMYEEGHAGNGLSINFSILPGSPAFPNLRIESESESEGFMTDECERPMRS